MEPFFERIAVIGTGLIGGSVALRAKKLSLVKEILGTDIDKLNLQKAKGLNAIDYYFDLEKDPDKIKGINLVVVSTPVNRIAGIVKRLFSLVSPATIITDTGSVKVQIIKEIENDLPPDIFFVGGHPIAGSELSGFANASENLFEGKKMILTPTDKTDAPSVERLNSFWKLMGMEVILMSPSEHDSALAAVSHIPHLIAYTLVNAIKDSELHGKDPLEFSGAGFKDLTRIARSDPDLWTAIMISNKDNILQMANSFKASLQTVISCMEREDWKSLTQEFTRAKRTRDKINEED